MLLHSLGQLGGRNAKKKIILRQSLNFAESPLAMMLMPLVLGGVWS